MQNFTIGIATQFRDLLEQDSPHFENTLGMTVDGAVLGGDDDLRFGLIDLGTFDSDDAVALAAGEQLRQSLMGDFADDVVVLHPWAVVGS